MTWKTPAHTAGKHRPWHEVGEHQAGGESERERERARGVRQTSDVGPGARLRLRGHSHAVRQPAQLRRWQLQPAGTASHTLAAGACTGGRDGGGRMPQWIVRGTTQAEAAAPHIDGKKEFKEMVQS